MVRILAGIDTGGTFTDLVLLQNGKMTVHKVLSNPDDPSQAIVKGLQDLHALDDLDVLVHGSTVATNAVLEHKGVVTGLVTTAGFRDVLEIGRQTRPKLYDLSVQKVPPLVPRPRRLEIVERLNERGTVLIPLDTSSLPIVLQTFQTQGVEAVALSFLFSFANPEHERRVAEYLRAAGLYVSVSSEIVPEFREYERTSTVVLNAYVGPLIDRYLARLEQLLPETSVLRIMQSNGGSLSSEMARREAARTLLSGPAAGVTGASVISQASGYPQVITLDIGGTSTDVALIDGTVTETTEGQIGGYPVKLPIIDIHTIGAGGGSVAWFDLGGALRVGPTSMGANPGPAAYGRGGREATVTDAHVVLGRLLPDAFLGGTMQLEYEQAANVVTRLAQTLATDKETAALGIIRVANANMEAAIRVISVERGCDPHHFTLVAFGGAGPLHACDLATALHIPRVLIPARPGVLSALGMLLADTLKDYVRTIMMPAEEAQELVRSILAELETMGRSDLIQENIPQDHIVIEPSLDLRYRGQSYELNIPFEGTMQTMISQFHTAHEQRFGYRDLHEHIQVVNVRLKARGLNSYPALDHQQITEHYSATPTMTRAVVFASSTGPNKEHIPIYERAALRPGAYFSGPALVTQYDTTTVIPSQWHAHVDAIDNLIIERVEEPESHAQ